MKNGFTAKTAADLGIDSDEKAQALGYDSIAKLNEALASSASNAQATWNKTIQVHSSAVQDAMNNMANLADVSFGTIQNYGNMLENLDQTGIADFDANMKALAQSAGD